MRTILFLKYTTYNPHPDCPYLFEVHQWHDNDQHFSWCLYRDGVWRPGNPGEPDPGGYERVLHDYQKYVTNKTQLEENLWQRVNTCVFRGVLRKYHLDFPQGYIR